MIALITDFGNKDPYAGIMKGAIKKANSSADIVDICHSVAPFSVLNAQFILHISYSHFPDGTTFCVVVDPGVGTDRKCIIARDRGFTFVLPDNGIISAVSSESMSFFVIDMKNFPGASATFHGRDIFGPVSARIDMGSEPGEFGCVTDHVVHAPFPPFTSRESSGEGFVAHIDIFGNIITTIPNKEIEINSAVQYRVSVGSVDLAPVPCITYGNIAKGVTGIIHGSSGFVEMAMKRDSAALHCGASTGVPISIDYEKS